MRELGGNESIRVPLEHRGQRLAADVPDVDAVVALAGADRQQLPIGAPGQTRGADLRPPVRQLAAGFQVEDRDPRRLPVRAADGESPAFGIERQNTRREVQRQPPNDPAFLSVPDGYAALQRTEQQAASFRVEYNTGPAGSAGCRSAPGVPGAIPAAG